jgi:glycosyltransferase involved in cell wall biosynthesis
MTKRKTKKVFFVIPSLAGGGAEKVITILLKHLNRDKFSLKLMLFNKIGEHLKAVPNDVEIIDLNKRTRWDFFKLIFKLRAIVKEEKPDILFSTLVYANIVTVLSGLFLQKRPRIVIREANNYKMYFPYIRLKILKTILMQFTYKKASKIIVISKGLKNGLSEKFKIQEQQIEVIYNPIDIGEITRLRGEIIAHPFIENNIPTVISIGRLSRQKNFELLLNAFALVIKEIPTCLIIVGQGELKDKLQFLSKTMGIDKYVYFAGFQRNPFAWLAKADLFVLSSRWEGFGNVIIEAMACGVPVISSDCPSGPNEIIESEKNGMLVPVNNADLLAKSMIRLLTNREEKKRICQNAYESIKKFDVANITSKYEKVFLLNDDE